MKIVICIFLVVTTFFVYSQVQDHQFINYDDQVYVTENLKVKSGLTRESVHWAFTTSHFSQWHPMTWLSHMLDYQLYGSNPKGHHLVNLFFHIANSLILFMVLLRMTGALWQSGFVAAMFALHPLNVESVAWIAERKNVLSTLFWLLTMWAYIRYAQKTNLTRYCLIVLFFTFGLMSKPMLVTLPFALLLMDYWPLGRLKLGQKKGNSGIAEKYTDKRSVILRLVYEKIPLFLLAAGSSVVTFIVQKSGGNVQAMEVFSSSARFTNAMVSCLEYLEKTVWPKGLAIFYPHPGNALAVWKGILCGVALVGITVIAIRLIRKAPYFIVGWFWYLGTLVPVIGIVQVGTQAMADRYAYVPLIGIFIIVAWGLPELMAKWRYKQKALSISAGILIPTLMTITWVQVSHWKNSITIFKHAIRVTDKQYPNFAVAHNNLGNALSAEQKFEEGISQYKTAIKLKPDFAMPYYNLGNALSAEQKIEEAISHYKTAIKLQVDFAEAHYNLGNALSAERKMEEAIFHYLIAIKLKPDFAEAHYNLGNIFLTMRETEEAIFHYKMAVKLKPDFAEAHSNLGDALSTERKTEEAIFSYKVAIKLKPDYAPTYNNLGDVLLHEQKTEEAISLYKIAIKLKPDFAVAHYNLGTALLEKGNINEVITHYKTAIKLKPDFTEARHNLKIALLRANKMEELKRRSVP